MALPGSLKRSKVRAMARALGRFEDEDFGILSSSRVLILALPPRCADFGESFHRFRFKVATDRSEATLVFVMM